MHKKYTLSASALLIALLTACSSGGGSGSSPSTSPQKQLQPKAKPEMPQPEAKPEVPQPEVKPEMPQPEVKPEVPQPESKPEMPQPEVKPEVPQPESKPEMPQPEPKPEVPQPESKPEMPQPEPKPEVPKPEVKPEVPSPPVKPIYTGAYFSDSINTKNHEHINKIVDKLPNGENLDTITINGKTIKLSDTADKSIKWLSFQDSLKNNNMADYNGGPVHLEHSIFGLYYTRKDPIDEIEGFSVGKQTPENALPTTGTIQYIGKAWNFMNGNSRAYVDLADIHFSADFANKTLNGSINGSDVKVELPEAKIEGSTFSGNAENIRIKGSFYGDKAQELGGVAVGTTKSNIKFSGAFGAKQKPEQ